MSESVSDEVKKTQQTNLFLQVCQILCEMQNKPSALVVFIQYCKNDHNCKKVRILHTFVFD